MFSVHEVSQVTCGGGREREREGRNKRELVFLVQ